MVTKEKPDETYYVKAESAGERLDVFLAKAATGISRSQLQKHITEGNVLVNGCAASKKDPVNEGDVITVNVRIVGKEFQLKAQDLPLEILFEDECLIAVNKPPAMVVHPGNGNHEGTLVNALLSKCQALSEGSAIERPGIVHRLDKDTSGVLIVAKTNAAHAALASLFYNRTIEKMYIGFCFGFPAESHGKIDLPLERSSSDPLKRAVSGTGKSALTEYWLLSHSNGVSAMRFKLYTGRTHQIRVHCSAKGFPIIGDTLYGGGNEYLMRIPPLDRPFASRIAKCFVRQALHAQSISFIHPFSEKHIHIAAPLPADFINAGVLFRKPGIFDSV